jgi:hypothetical protein
VTKAQAAWESLWRTAIQAGLGAVVVYLGSQVITEESLTSADWWRALLVAVGSAIVAAIMRTFVPTATDHPGTARTDLAA